MAKSGYSSQSGRSPDFRIIALPAPSRHFDSGSSRGLTDYSGASAADSHRFPFSCSLDEHHQAELNLLCVP